MEEKTFCQCGEEIHLLGSGAWVNVRRQVCCRGAEHVPERVPEMINRSATDRRYTPEGRYLADNKYDSVLEHCAQCGIQIGLVNGQWSNPLSGYICQFRHHAPVESKLLLLTP
jgi:hypothetical protein